MRRRRNLLIIPLIILLMLAGCVRNAPEETTAPPETTVPAETTLPPETTAPPETTLPEETDPSDPIVENIWFHEMFEEEGFFYYCGELSKTNPGYDYRWVIYLYTGDSPVIEMKSMGIILTLPEDWLDRVMIIRRWDPPYDEFVYIINKGLWAAYNEDNPTQNPYDGLRDYIFAIHRDPIRQHDDPEEYRNSPYFLSEIDKEAYFLMIGPSADWEIESPRNTLIQRIGQEAFDEIIGDLVVDFETAQEMITFTH